MACRLCKETAGRVSSFGPHVGSAPSASVVRFDAPALELLLDNVRSVLNVGSIFRTAEGAAVQHLHLCGITPTPEHPKLTKTALGAEASLAWTYHKNGLDAVAQAKRAGKQLWGLEYASAAKSLYAKQDAWPAQSFDQDATVMLVVGNELSGIDPAILQRCDRLVYLPMLGAKQSLNVAVAAGAAVYHIRFGLAAALPGE